MIVLFSACIFLFVICSLVAYFFARKRNAIYWSDFILPFVVVFGWVAMTVAGFGHQSLSHVIEVPIALLFTFVIFNLRVFVIDKYSMNYRRNSYIVLLLSIVFIFLLRAFMPFMPE